MLSLSSSTFEHHGPWRGSNVAPPAYFHDVQYLIFWGHLRLAPEEASMLFTLLRLYWAVGVVTSFCVTTRKMPLAAGGISEVPVTSNSLTWSWKIEFSDEMLHLLADAEKG